MRAAAGVPVAVCGEMGGRPLEAMALIGLGIDRLSITPAAVGPIKAMLRTLDRAAIDGARWRRWLAARRPTCAPRWPAGPRRKASNWTDRATNSRRSRALTATAPGWTRAGVACRAARRAEVE